MPISERAAAIRHARRALQALGDQPAATRKQLGAARERLNDCYRLSDPAMVWAAATNVEARVDDKNCFGRPTEGAVTEMQQGWPRLPHATSTN